MIEPGPLEHRQIIAALNLKPHPEGGYYREIFRSQQRVKEGERDRSALTTIYYLLDSGESSKWHVVESDEVWHFYLGASLLLLDYNPISGALTQLRLGTGYAPPSFVHVIPAGHWQAAIAATGFCLMGCTVAPGFEFSDFQMVRHIAGHESAFNGVMQGFAHLL